LRNYAAVNSSQQLLANVLGEYEEMMGGAGAGGGGKGGGGGGVAGATA
jgi:hypothetical protein